MNAMSSASNANKAKTTPERMHYIQGYVPVSYSAPHSSLERSSTWIGMGLLLASLAGFGAVLMGLAAWSVGSREDWMTYVWIGAVFGIVGMAAGVLLVMRGRSGYKEYSKETGRSH